MRTLATAASRGVVLGLALWAGAAGHVAAQILIEGERRPYSAEQDRAEREDLAAASARLAGLEKLHAEKETDLVRRPSSGISENLQRTDELRSIEAQIREARDRIVSLEGRIARREDARRREQEARESASRPPPGPLKRPPSTPIPVKNIEGGMSDHEFNEFLKNKAELDGKLAAVAGTTPATGGGEAPAGQGPAIGRPAGFGKDEAMLAGWLIVVIGGSIAYVRIARGKAQAATVARRPGAWATRVGSAPRSVEAAAPRGTEAGGGAGTTSRDRLARRGLGVVECPIHHISYTEATGCPRCNK